jgi:ABC-2 type transport system ATP-binding protein
VIETENLTRRFGDMTAVDALTLTIAEGEVFGLLGPNGAGKTTTIRMLAGLIGKTSGEARVAGCRVGDPATARNLRGLVGLMPEEAGPYPDLSAARTLDFFGRLYQVPRDTRAERAERLLTMLDLWDRRDTRVRTFSKGMKQRLTIARALINDPPVLFLDEPTANLDPEGAKTVRDFLLRLKREKRTILLNTHQLAEAERVCDRVGIMHARLIAVGTPDGLRGTGSERATAIQLAVVTDAVVAAARDTSSGWTASRASVEVAGNTITVPVARPERDNPELVKAIVAAGGEIQFVSGTAPSLEEIYLKLLARDYEPRGYEPRGYEPRGYEPRGYEHSEQRQPTDQQVPARQ